jgi:hypothetical protein
MYSDVLTFGNLMTPRTQKFGIVDNPPQSLETDAILGLSFKEIAEPGINPVFQTLQENRLLNADIFGIKVTVNGDVEEFDIALGGTNSDLFIEPIIFVEVSEIVGFSLEHRALIANEYQGLLASNRRQDLHG